MKRYFTVVVAVILLFTNIITAYACDENQSNIRVREILFGDDALRYSSDENVKLLLDAMYLCCEQADNQGQNKVDQLKLKKVDSVPSISDINIKNGELIDCSHIAWDSEYLTNKKARKNRKRLLQNAVNKVFDFGLFNNWFGSETGKCNSFAALLYYSHILADYLADDPEDTETQVKGKSVSAYCGQPYIELNNNKPNFTIDQKNTKATFINYSSLDKFGRAGVVFACIGADTISNVGERKNMVKLRPSGFNLNKDNYDGIVNSQPAYVYYRCHLLAHSLGGEEQETNLVTGTNYMNNQGMKPFEDDVAKYIKSTGNHVLYRATPIFDGDNKVVSGVQIEAFSIEDAGNGICFNVYFYNVQPGININYASGENELADMIHDSEVGIPFVVNNSSESNPDLIYEVNKHLAVLFDDQKNSGIYNTMMGDINTIAYETRSIGTNGDNSASQYLKMKNYEYQYYKTLKLYVPMLLRNEEFFKSVFK
ncbi:DNA/RNA non-specific endonuclease [Oribacterium sp. WCC10]|uniref:DNA/RNA non-specific endonuclease n=1 Tax=Oribacterium sp. WCC10 TaxID=1855343 RepID=UPI0008F08963|nr:DNA/RNA non-specific endonuclease [Oribacterium sp. WCC10]SFG31053.1 DNA/RNA non-specific endonuclease [Oribacterium sp. WCC10]